MVRSVTLASRSVACTLVLALALVSSANCLLGAEMTPAQQACCAAMNHDCGQSSVQQDCCAAESPSLIGLSPATSLSLVVPPVPVTIAVIEPAADPVLSLGVSASTASNVGPPKPSSRRTYLFVSVFRL